MGKGRVQGKHVSVVDCTKVQAFSTFCFIKTLLNYLYCSLM